jgi:uncharacterized RDD family membrane protein YckC
MSRTVTVTTPENVQVTYQVAGFASRFVATLIDLTIQLLLLLLAVGIFNGVAAVGGTAGVGVGSIAYAFLFIAIFLIWFVYASFFELLWGGRTPGKRIMGLRVIRESGHPIDLISSAARNVLRFIDFGVIPVSPILVLFGLPGLVSIFFSPTYKRIGDYAAGTLVIVEAGASPFAQQSVVPPSAEVAGYLPLIRNLDRLTNEDYRLVRRFTARRAELDLNVQAALAERLARPLLDRLEIPVQIMYQIQFADLLEAIERRYAEDRGLL